MQIEVRATNFSLQPGVRDYIERRVFGALDRFDGRIGHAQVVLSNLHGRNHIRELHCRVNVALNHAEDVLIEQTDHDLVAAVDMAADRLKRTVRRHINRRRAMHRERRSPMAA